MRIVHIEDYFKPTMGYQINIIPAYQVKQGHEVIIVSGYLSSSYMSGGNNLINQMTRCDKEYEERTGVKVIRVGAKRMISNRMIFHNNIIKLVNDLKPDIVYVHGNDTFIGIKYILQSGRLPYPLVTDSHMLEMASRNKFKKIFRMLYRMFVTPQIIKNQIKVIRTQNDNFIEINYGIPLKQAPFISYGSELELFHPNESTKITFRNEYNIQHDSVIFMYAGKITADKGGLLLAETFRENFKNTRGKEAILLLIGDTDNEYGKKVDALLNISQNRIIKFKAQNYRKLPEFYQVADVALFPKQCSLSFYDVQACGLPVISEANNINIERNSNGNGLNFNIDDVNDFRRKIIEILELSDEEFSKMEKNSINYIKNNYNYKDIAEKYTNVLKEELTRWGKGNINV